MKPSIAILLPAMALAQQQVVGNPTGVALGIFAMCGTDPVDCNNGWCCLNGQICTLGPRGANTQCIDPSFTENGAKGVTVNAAYFQKIQVHQNAQGANVTTAMISTQQPIESSSAERSKSQSISYALLAALAGLVTMGW